jgi:hypothetical protein
MHNVYIYIYIYMYIYIYICIYVCRGFKRGEEMNLLKTIRMFVTKGIVGAQEFQSGIYIYTCISIFI